MVKIEHYSFGSLKAGGRSYRDDVKIVAGQVRGDWWRKQGHLLQAGDIQDILEDGPDILVLGTGSSGLLRVDPSLEDLLESRNIRLLAMPTAQAVERFNQLSARGERVAGAFHLTC